MPRPMPVEPRFSRRLSILNSIALRFVSSLSSEISSRRMSSLVLPTRSSLTASSEKNSRSSMLRRKLLAPASAVKPFTLQLLFAGPRLHV